MSTTSRFGNGPNNDNTGRTVTQDYLAIAYAASIALKPLAAKTIYKIGAATGALSLTIDTVAPLIGDEVIILFTSDATGSRVVTFSTGFNSPGTISLAASKFGKAAFTFDGTSWIGSGTATA